MLKLFSRKNQNQKQDVRKKKFEITDMHCSACCLEIDEMIEKIPGVKLSSTSYARGTVEVETISEVNDEKIIQAIEEAGYTAAPLP